jgi:hypothetical protein
VNDIIFMTLGLIPKLQRWIHVPNELVNGIRFQIDPQLKEGQGQNPEIRVVVDRQMSMGLIGLLVSVKSTFDRNRAFLSFELSFPD